MPMLPILRKLGSGISQDGQSPKSARQASPKYAQSPKRVKEASPWHRQSPKSAKCMLYSDLSPKSAKRGSPRSGRQRPNVKFYLDGQSSTLPSDDEKKMVQLQMPGSYQTEVRPVPLTKGSGESLQKRRPKIKLSIACTAPRDQDTFRVEQYDEQQGVGQGSVSMASSSGDAKPVPTLPLQGSCQESVRSVSKDSSALKPVPPKEERSLSKRRPGINLTLACPSYRDQDTLQQASSWAEQFDLHEQLGQGSTGVVRRAIRKADKLEVAVKIMQAFDDEMVSIRREEFELLQKIEHPHIVKAVDFFAAQGHAVIVLGYFPSQTLDDAVQNSPEHRLPESTSRVLSQMLFQAIDCLHQHRIVHRDVKAANILVSYDLTNLCLVDFNVARCMLEGGSLTMTGTSQYLPPEVLQGASPSESCDVWSAGLCLHMMLAGCLPWWSSANRNPASYAKKILSKPLRLEGTPWESVSDECKNVLKLCLSLDMKLRPAPTTLLQHAWFQGSKSKKRSQNKTLPSSKFATQGPSAAQEESTRQISKASGFLRSKTQDFESVVQDQSHELPD